MKAQSVHLINGVVGAYADAKSAHPSRLESKGVPFDVHTINDFVGVDSHFVEGHCQSVHECDINIPPAVIHHLNVFCHSDVTDRIGPNLDNDLKDLLGDSASLLVPSRNDLPDRRQCMNPVAGIDTLRTVADFEINSAF